MVQVNPIHTEAAGKEGVFRDVKRQLSNVSFQSLAHSELSGGSDHRTGSPSLGRRIEGTASSTPGVLKAWKPAQAALDGSKRYFSRLFSSMTNQKEKYSRGSLTGFSHPVHQVSLATALGAGCAFLASEIRVGSDANMNALSEQQQTIHTFIAGFFSALVSLFSVIATAVQYSLLNSTSRQKRFAANFMATRGMYSPSFLAQILSPMSQYWFWGILRMIFLLVHIPGFVDHNVTFRNLRRDVKIKSDMLNTCICLIKTLVCTESLHLMFKAKKFSLGGFVSKLNSKFNVDTRLFTLRYRMHTNPTAVLTYFVMHFGCILIYLVYTFESSVSGGIITSLWDATYFGVVTLTTLGYGDLFPLTHPGRGVALCMIFFGLCFIALMTAVVAKHLDMNPREQAISQLLSLWAQSRRVQNSAAKWIWLHWKYRKASRGNIQTAGVQQSHLHPSRSAVSRVMHMRLVTAKAKFFKDIDRQKEIEQLGRLNVQSMTAASSFALDTLAREWDLEQKTRHAYFDRMEGKIAEIEAQNQQIKVLLAKVGEIPLG